MIGSPRIVDVYLIHFDMPYRHAQHYIGVTTEGRIDERFAEHVAGRGAHLTDIVRRAGITMRIARTWLGVPRFTEVKLKKRGSAKRICPICKGEGFKQ